MESRSRYAHVSRLSDSELLSSLEGLLGERRRVDAALIAHLAEVDQRKLYAELGFDSLYRYCTEQLRLSDSCAYHAIHAARVAARFPIVLEFLADGRHSKSGVVVLAPHLTPNNHVRLLEAAAGLSKRQIEELVATMFPKADASACIERVAEAAADLLPTAEPSCTQRPRRPVAPLREDRFKVQFTASRELRDQIEELQALLRHQIPDGDLGLIFQKAVELLLSDVRKRRFAETARPKRVRTALSGLPSRNIPADVKRAVYTRDAGRCTFVSRTGRRCGTKAFLEYHHLIPWARSKRHRAAEITLRCRAHNQLAARQDFGSDFMRRFERSPGMG